MLRQPSVPDLLDCQTTVCERTITPSVPTHLLHCVQPDTDFNKICCYSCRPGGAHSTAELVRVGRHAGQLADLLAAVRQVTQTSPPGHIVTMSEVRAASSRLWVFRLNRKAAGGMFARAMPPRGSTNSFSCGFGCRCTTRSPHQVTTSKSMASRSMQHPKLSGCP